MILWIAALVCAAQCIAPQLDVPEEFRKNVDGNKLILPVDHQDGEHLYGNWTRDAITSIIDCFARERLKNVPPSYSQYYEICRTKSNRIGTRALCFMKIVRKERKMRKRNRKKTLKRTDIHIQRKLNRLNAKYKEIELEKKKPSFFHFRDAHSQYRRIRRSVASKNSYSLKDPRGEGTILSTIARHLKKSISIFYTGKDDQKKKEKSWRSLVEKLRILRKKAEKKELMEKMLLKGMKVSSTRDNGRGETQRTRDPIRDKAIMEGMGLLRKGVELTMSMSGKPKEEFEGKTLRILSPHLSSNQDNDKDEISILSPSAKPTSADSEAWLDFIMTTSGATQGMKEAMKHLENEDSMQKDEPIRMTESDVEETLGKKERRKIDVIRKMEKTYTKEQMNSFRHRGFSFMTPYQKELVYGRRSPYSDPVLIKSTRAMSAQQMEKKFLRAFKMLADKEEEYGKRMKQDIILSPLLFGLFVDSPLYTGSTVLSPVLFSTFVTSPVLVGPLILSPWVFSPIIISPWALVPIVLSPFAFSPIILSPVALGVYVLSPGILSPAILSPILMVPYILSPNALSPLILSPLVLSPFVMSPTAMSPVILSPLVLSPAVYSDSFNSSLILSPSVLSPPIESKQHGGIILLSPGI